MTIGPFQRTRKDWLLVVGLRSFPVDESATGTASAGRVPCMTYDSHWTLNNTWSVFATAMTFPTQDAAIEYLNKNCDRMELAKVDD